MCRQGLVASACSACVCLGSCCCRGTGAVSPRSAKAINFLFLLGGVVVTLLLYRYGDDIPGTHGFFSIKAVGPQIARGATPSLI